MRWGCAPIERGSAAAASGLCRIPHLLLPQRPLQPAPPAASGRCRLRGAWAAGEASCPGLPWVLAGRSGGALVNSERSRAVAPAARAGFAASPDALSHEKRRLPSDSGAAQRAQRGRETNSLERAGEGLQPDSASQQVMHRCQAVRGAHQRHAINRTAVAAAHHHAAAARRPPRRVCFLRLWGDRHGHRRVRATGPGLRSMPAGVPALLARAGVWTDARRHHWRCRRTGERCCCDRTTANRAGCPAMQARGRRGCQQAQSALQQRAQGPNRRPSPLATPADTVPPAPTGRSRSAEHRVNAGCRALATLRCRPDVRARRAGLAREPVWGRRRGGSAPCAEPARRPARGRRLGAAEQLGWGLTRAPPAH